MIAYCKQSSNNIKFLFSLIVEAVWEETLIQCENKNLISGNLNPLPCYFADHFHVLIRSILNDAENNFTTFFIFEVENVYAIIIYACALIIIFSRALIPCDK